MEFDSHTDVENTKNSTVSFCCLSKDKEASVQKIEDFLEITLSTFWPNLTQGQSCEAVWQYFINLSENTTWVFTHNYAEHLAERSTNNDLAPGHAAAM